MPMTVDDLQIEIKAQAVKANDAIDKLDGKLNKLGRALGNLNAQKLADFGKAAKDLSLGMSSLKVDKINKSDYKRLAEGIERIASVDAPTIYKAGIAIRNLAGSLGALKKVDVAPTSKQVADLAKGISQLGYKSATQAIDNIPKLAQGMSQMMRELSKAPRVSQNLIDMTNALAKLARTGASSGRAATALGKSLDSYTASTGRARRGTFSLAGALGKLYASYWLIFRAFGKLGESINLASSLTEVENVVNTTFGEYASLVDKMADTSIADFGMSELTTKKVASRFQAMGTAMEIPQKKIAEASQFLEEKGVTAYGKLGDSMADVSISLTKLTADMASFYNVEQDAVAEDLASIFTGETRPLRDYGLDLTQATLAEWAMKQGLDANIQSMSQAEKALLRYQYVLANTGAAQGDFAKTAGTWANQVRMLKQNFEALGVVVGRTLINALRPLVIALNNAMGHIIAFAKTVSNALGKIFGWKFEVTTGGGTVTDDMSDAADYSDDLASGMGTAADNAKKLKTHLLGIDELNVVQSDDDSASGAGSGGLGNLGSAGGAGAGDGWTKTETIWKDFESEIDSLFELGEYIGETLIAMMQSIDWDAVYEKARNFGSGLAEFMNGLISPELFYETGKLIANSLNTALEALNSWARDFEWEEFGVSLAFSLKGFFANWDAELTGETFSTLAIGILDGLSGALDGLVESDVLNDLGQKIVDLICGIKWGELAWSLVGFLDSFKNAVIEAPIDLFTGIAQAIADRVFGEGEVEIDFPAWSEDILTVSLGAAFPAFGLFSKIPEQSELEKMLRRFGIMDTEIDQDGYSGISAEVEDYGYALEYANRQMEEQQRHVEATRSTWESLSTGFSTIWGDAYASLESDTEQQLQNQQQHAENVRSTWDKLGTTLKTVWDDAKKAFDGFKIHVGGDGSTSSLELGIPDLKAGIQQVWGEVQTWWSKNIVTWWNDSVAPWFTAETWYTLLDGIKQGFADKWAELVAWWQESAIYTWWTENVQPWFTVDRWQTELDNIKKSFKTKWDETVGQWKIGIQEWWDKHVQPWFTKDKWLELGENLKNGIYEGFKGLANKVVDVLNRVISSLESMVNSALNGINSLLSMLNESGLGEFFGFDFHVGSVSFGRIPHFLEGGFPERASLFFAGENGIPEILGTVGGRTAVAGGDEITGIRQAVYDTGSAETALMETMISLLQVIAEKETSFELDGRELITAIDERRARNGFSFAT